MTLRGMANGITSTLNPNVSGSLLPSTGNTTSASGKQVPSYGRRINGVRFQVQPLSASDIKHLDALNIQGVERAVYIDGQLEGVRRLVQKGGDMLYFNSAWWLVRAVIEPWDASGWCKVGVTQQTKAPV